MSSFLHSLDTQSKSIEGQINVCYQAQPPLVMSFIWLQVCNDKCRTVCCFKVCCLPIFSVLVVTPKITKTFSKWLFSAVECVIVFTKNYVNMCFRFARHYCSPCLLCLCLWSVRKMALRWTLTNSSLPCQTTPCSWLWSLDRHGDHSLYVSPNTQLKKKKVLNVI